MMISSTAPLSATINPDTYSEILTGVGAMYHDLVTVGEDLMVLQV